MTMAANSSHITIQRYLPAGGAITRIGPSPAGAAFEASLMVRDPFPLVSSARPVFLTILNGGQVRAVIRY